VVSCRAKHKVLKKAVSARGAAATRAAEAKKAAEVRKATADPADMASSPGHSAAVSKAAGTTASSAGPVAGDGASASASSAEATRTDTELAMARGPEGEHPVDPPVTEKEQTAAEGGGSPAADIGIPDGPAEYSTRSLLKAHHPKFIKARKPIEASSMESRDRLGIETCSSTGRIQRASRQL
jgi:hypothetical protein